MIRKRGKTYAVRVYDPQAKNNQRWVGTFPTHAEAREAERTAETAIAPSARARTVGEWVAVWLRDYQRSAPATRRTYAYATKRIVTDIGEKRLDRIDRPTARRLANEWPNQVSRVARTLFADATRDGLIALNPFTDLRLETPKGRKDLTALSEDEIAALASAAVKALGPYGPEFAAAVTFLGYVGCRPGELCALRHADLDATKGEIAIRFSLDGQGGEKAPKNGKPRVVVVPPPALQAALSVARRLDSPYLFHSARGKRLSKLTLSYNFRLVRAAWHAAGGREKVEPYELRHAAATNLMHRGLPPHVVAAQLGHSDGGALVQRLYGHPEEGRMRDQVHLAFAGWEASEAQPARGRREGSGAA